MRPGLEEEFNRETAELFDQNTRYAVRAMNFKRDAFASTKMDQSPAQSIPKTLKTPKSIWRN
jgi:hypothetical protein